MAERTGQPPEPGRGRAPGAAANAETAANPNAADAAALIVSDDALAAGVASLGNEVGVDTEFRRIRTFHPVPALYQLAGEGRVTLVDATAPATFAALKALLLDGERAKVMHSCSEDLEVVAHHLNVCPRNVVDTQLAHAFVSADASASYAALVEHYLGVRIGKQETRSNWLRRPLTPAQLEYARLDVAYLTPIWRAQRDALRAADRMPWFEEEMQRVLTTPATPPERWYRNVKGAWRLKPCQLAVLRSLVAWREREARRRDLPRGWTVRDEALFTMARWPRLQTEDVAKLLPGRAGRRYAPALVEAHQRGLADPHPPAREPRPLSPRASELAHTLRGIVARHAERLNIAPSLLARKRDVEAAVRHHRDQGDLPEHFRGWRRAVLGDEFDHTLANAW